jgi:hypothetical protein
MNADLEPLAHRPGLLHGFLAEPGSIWVNPTIEVRPGHPCA